MRKFLLWGFVIVVGLYIYHQPHAAAHTWDHLMAFGSHVANSVTVAFQSAGA